MVNVAERKKATIGRYFDEWERTHKVKDNHLKRLSDRFRFDYNKDFRVVEYNGNYTAKKLLKAVYGNLEDEQIIGITCLDLDGQLRQPQVFKIDRWGDMDFINLYWTCYSKKEFNAIRKRTDIKTVVIAQKIEDLRQSKPYCDDVLERQRDVDYRYWQHDKSGYLVEYFRSELRERLSDKQAREKKEEFLQTDFSDKATEIIELRDKKRAEFIEKLTNAETREDFHEVSKEFDRSINLIYELERATRFKERIESKDFNSVADAEEFYNSVRNALSNE